MSQLIIHYGSLEDAAKQAKTAGENLQDYASQAQKKIAAKISSYAGDRTGNINAAQDYINQKIAQLNGKAEAYLQYANDVNKFREKAKSVDSQVKEKITNLSKAFKASYGIKDNIITAVFNFLSDQLNKTALGRFFKDAFSAGVKAIQSLKDRIVEWYKYNGGKYVVDAVLAVGAAVVAVCAIVAAIVAGGPLIVVIAGVIAGAISLANAVTNCRNSLVAYSKEKAGDPAWAKRYGDLNTFTDTIRAKSNSEAWHTAAGVVDTVEFVANVITVGYSGCKALKNFKSIAGKYGGFKQYFKYQYTSGKQGASVVKNALFGSGDTKARARTLIKTFKDGAVTKCKNTISLYANPRNWLAKGSQREILTGYSTAAEDMGVGKVSSFYNGTQYKAITWGKHNPAWLNQINLQRSNRTLQGFSGILRGTDRSFSNIAVTVKHANDVWKAAKTFNPLNMWKSANVSEMVWKNGNATNVQVKVSDVTGTVEKMRKLITDRVMTDSGMAGGGMAGERQALRQNWQWAVSRG